MSRYLFTYLLGSRFMTDDNPIGFGFGASNNLKCLSCANRVKYGSVHCSKILKRLADYCDKHPDMPTNSSVFTDGLNDAMTGCSNYIEGGFEESSLASTFSLVNALSALAQAEDRTKFIGDTQTGVCSNCGRRDWRTVDLTADIAVVVKKLKCRECGHEWEEVFTFREKNK